MSKRFTIASAVIFSLYFVAIITLEFMNSNVEQSDLVLLLANLKLFVFYMLFIISLGFILFSSQIIKYESMERSKAYRYISLAIISYLIHISDIIFPHMVHEGFCFFQLIIETFLGVTVTLFVIALNRRTNAGIFKKIYKGQLVLIPIGILFYALMPDLLFPVEFVQFLIILLALVASRIYSDQMDGGFVTKMKSRYFFVILFIFLGQMVLVFIRMFTSLDLQFISTTIHLIPVFITIYLLIRTVTTEMSLIRLKNNSEKQKLVDINTNIYEYVSEGVFSLAENMIVNDTYTKICSEIFGKDISGMRVGELLADHDTSAELTERLLTNLFTKKMPWLVGIELLPKELKVNYQVYALNYEKIFEGENISEIIVKMTNVSDTIELQEEMIFERDKLALSITSIMNREELLPLVNEFIEYLDGVHFTLENHVEQLNIIHTYKGNFGIFKFINLTQSLHDLENILINHKEVTEDDINIIRESLYSDLELITETTGSSFFEDNLYLKANVNNLESVYNEIKKYFYDTEASLIIYIIKKIFNKSIKDSILFYAREARKRAEDNGKEIKTIMVQGDEIFVDFQYYKNALRSLVHVFNNCVDHGIEEEEERLLLGKPRVAEIQCRLNDFGNFFEITIKDDGRGINVEKLRMRLVENDILTEDESFCLSEEEIIEHVFDPEISTMDEASLSSGRGVGLASVRDEVEKVGGEIRIVSFMDFGTEIKILLPKENEALISYFSLPLLMDLFVEAFKIFVKSNNIFELPLNVQGTERIEEIHNYAIRIPFGGPEKGYFFMSLNRDILYKFACYITDDLNLSEAEFEEITMEVLKETCNIVAGNSTSIFDLNQKYISIESPEEIEKEFFDVNELIYRWHMIYGDYDIILGLILE